MRSPYFNPFNPHHPNLPLSPPPLLPPLHSSRRSNGHATPNKEGIEVLGVLQGRLFKAEPTRSWTPLASGDVELSIVQKKGEPFLTFFLTVGSDGVEVRSSTASSCDAVLSSFALCLSYFPLCYVLVATCTEKGMSLLWHIANYTCPY